MSQNPIKLKRKMDDLPILVNITSCPYKIYFGQRKPVLIKECLHQLKANNRVQT